MRSPCRMQWGSHLPKSYQQGYKGWLKKFYLTSNVDFVVKRLHGHAWFSVHDSWWKRLENAITRSTRSLWTIEKCMILSPNMQAMWLVLWKYGVPPAMVEIIQSLHDEMKVEVIVDGSAIPEIEVQNGLHQGWSMAPTLFNLYFNLAMVQSWRQHCQPFGIDV